jgi:hypothetical protein
MFTTEYRMRYSALSILQCLLYIEMLVITIPNLSSKHYQIIEMYSGYIDTFSLSHQYRNNVESESLLYCNITIISKSDVAQLPCRIALYII